MKKQKIKQVNNSTNELIKNVESNNLNWLDFDEVIKKYPHKKKQYN